MDRRTDNFTLNELRCQCEVCALKEPHQITDYALDKLQSIREALNEVMILSSAFRCENHPIEMFKSSPGTHNRGAFDVKAPDGAYAMRLLKVAVEHGATGIGFSLSSSDRSVRYMHIDFDVERTVPVIWSY